MIVSLYEKLRMAGCQIDHHESDLYVKATNAAKGTIKDAQREEPSILMEHFRSELDKELWICVPFHYAPFWEEKQSKA